MIERSDDHSSARSPLIAVGAVVLFVAALLVLGGTGGPGVVDTGPPSWQETI
jgi:hypothetical protein